MKFVVHCTLNDIVPNRPSLSDVSQFAVRRQFVFGERQGELKAALLSLPCDSVGLVSA